VLNDYPDINLLDADINGTGSYNGGLEAMAYALQALEEKRPNWLGTSAQFPKRMSREAVQIGLGLLNGGKVERELVLIKPEFIDVSNYHQFSRW
jgi:ribose transport system substrate-binding protein